jgi:hypothetical protein
MADRFEPGEDLLIEEPAHELLLSAAHYLSAIALKHLPAIVSGSRA